MTCFAHRGGSGYGIGNTLTAIQRSIALGIYGIEIDIRACSDSLVVTHYDKLGDPNGQGLDSLKSFPLEKVREFGINSQGKIIWAPTTVDGNSIERIPTLAEVFALCKGKNIKILLDIKDDIIPEILALVEKFDIESQIIYGVHDFKEIDQIRSYSLKYEILLFGERKNIDKIIAAYPVDLIRLWQSWITNRYGEITDPDNLIEKIRFTGKKVIIMAGNPNVINGGKLTMGQLKKLQCLNVYSVIMDDPAMFLEL